MSESQTLVVKLGTSVLTGGSRRLNRAHIVELVRQCAQLHAMGHRIVIVTSGAIAAGREHLGYPELPATIASKQLLAAVGQSRLIQLWEQLFSIYGIHVGQMLLTRADMEDRERFLNARDTLRALWSGSPPASCCTWACGSISGIYVPAIWCSSAPGPGCTLAFTIPIIISFTPRAARA